LAFICIFFFFLVDIRVAYAQRHRELVVTHARLALTRGRGGESRPTASRDSAFNALVAPGAAAAARSAVATAATAASTVTVMRFVDLQRAAVEVLAVEGLHRLGGVGIGHLDEAEAARAAGVTISDEGDFLDSAVRGKQGTHAVFGRGKGQISDVEFGHFRVLAKGE